MKEFEVGEEVYGLYGVSAFIIGKISKIDGKRISIQCKKPVVTISVDDVFYSEPENKKLFLL